MKRVIPFLFLFMVLPGINSFSQLSGIKTIPGDYSSVALAIADLNAQGAGPGGVTFNIQAGHTETLPSLTSGLFTVSGTSANPIVFQKSGAGANPAITAAPGTAAVAEYIFCIKGGDYITFDNINISDPSGTVEWGFALLKSSAIDGAQFNIIKNCSISLNKTNTASVGIYANNVTPENPTGQLAVTALSGANSDNKFSGNTIQNAYNGISVNGYADAVSPYLYYDQNNEIGVDGANAISNFGGGSPANNGIYAIYQNNLKVANNVVNGPSAGSGVCSGIQIGTCNNANLDVFNNTVSIDYSGTNQFYGIFDNHGNVFSGNTVVKVYGNTVSNCTFPTAAKVNCQYIWINGGGATCQFYNNIVTNNTYGSSTSTASGQLAGIYHNGNQAIDGSLSYHHNQVTNITRIQSVVGAGVTYYQFVNGGKSYVEMYDNLVDNCTVASNGDCIGFRALNSAIGTKLLYNNTVTNLYNANGKLEGLTTSNSTGTTLYNNKVMNLTTLGTTGTVTGINLSTLMSPGGNLYCYNNFIADLYAPASIYPYAIYGINGNGSQMQIMGIYNNSVYLNATSTGANFGTYGIYLTYLPGSIELKNNISVNTSTANGTGITAAVGFYDYRYSNYSTTSNNNDFFAGVPGPKNLIFYAGPNQDQTLAQFQARVYPAESNSITEFPPFVSTVRSTCDLHIRTSVPTRVESGGMVVATPSIVNDYDLDPRYPNAGYPVHPDFMPFAPDMGADEFGGLYLDTIPPAITFTPLSNTPSYAARTLFATITDPSGVPVSASGLPVIAWKKNLGGIWTSAAGTYQSGNEYSFTLAPTVQESDTVYYYLIAQDMATVPNIGTSPFAGASGFSANPPAAAVPPSAPEYYVILEAGIADTVIIQDITIEPESDTCFNASQLVVLAGNGTTFHVGSGASVEIISGSAILFNHGVTVSAGGYLHAWITQTNDYCQNPLNPLTAAAGDNATATGTESIQVEGDLAYSVYPNPTEGRITVSLKGDYLKEIPQIGIYDITGQMAVAKKRLTGFKTDFDLSGQKSGVYFVRIETGKSINMIKIIKL